MEVYDELEKALKEIERLNNDLDDYEERVKQFRRINNEINKELLKRHKEIERLNNIMNTLEEDLEREINIKEEDLKIEHSTYIDIKSTLEKVLKRLKELKGEDKE